MTNQQKWDYLNHLTKDALYKSQLAEGPMREILHQQWVGRCFAMRDFENVFLKDRTSPYFDPANSSVTREESSLKKMTKMSEGTTSE